MSRNVWRDLLPTTEAIKAMTPEALSEAGNAADCCARTLAYGVAAVGNLLAGAALNEEHGLDAGAIADLGWLLQSMGELSATLADTHEGVRLRSTQGD
jgi:hypothetical protein